jgi:hypothetical protein
MSVKNVRQIVAIRDQSLSSIELIMIASYVSTFEPEMLAFQMSGAEMTSA